MEKKGSNYYTDLLNCRDPEEVRQRVRKWASSLSDQDHLIRSTILDIHASIESRLKQILYHIMLPLIFQDDNERENKRRKAAWEEEVGKMSFMAVYRLLKPCLDAFPTPDLSKNINDINEVRRQVVHKVAEKPLYKGRNPFQDHDCLAQLYFEAWAVDKELCHFFERRVEDPREKAKIYERYYREHIDKPTSKGRSGNT